MNEISLEAKKHKVKYLGTDNYKALHNFSKSKTSPDYSRGIVSMTKRGREKAIGYVYSEAAVCNTYLYLLKLKQGKETNASTGPLNCYGLTLLLNYFTKV